MSTKKEYNFRYFKNYFPKWKYQKDAWISHYLYRPISFYIASIAVKMGLSANDVSLISLIVAIAASGLYFTDSCWLYVVGALLVNFWLTLDCSDGNIARCVKKEPFGEFVDALSSYILVNLLFFGVGLAVYRTGGFLIPAGQWQLLLLGGFTGASDSLGRLIFQKYENVRQKQSEAVIAYSAVRENTEKMMGEKNFSLVYIHDRMDAELGAGGIMGLVLLFCSSFHCLDIFLLFYMTFYIGTFILELIYLIRKARYSDIVKGE